MELKEAAVLMPDCFSSAFVPPASFVVLFVFAFVWHVFSVVFLAVSFPGQVVKPVKFADLRSSISCPIS